MAQRFDSTKAHRWADSVYATLSPQERITQLMTIRLSTIDMKTKQVTYLYEKAQRLVKNYNIGGICVFQGRPDSLVLQLNRLQLMAKTPIMVSVDGEWGLSMRLFDHVMPLPKQMMLGALADSSLVYRYGKTVAKQCKRMGIHMNYAPVVDVNNNPDNPVINDRSFGENKYKVARFGIQYMKGMQDEGVLACAKHFPGHGDVAVDSHLDLPIINKTREQLDTLELYPFRKMIEAGVASVMVAHLFIPSIDARENRPTSLSENNIRYLLQEQLQFKGLVVTDAMEMMGVKKFFPGGEGSVEAIIAGADMLCLPDSVELVIEKVEKAMAENRITPAMIEQRCKKVLAYKYLFGVHQTEQIDTTHLVEDLNKEIPALRKEIAEKSITLLKREDDVFLWNNEFDSSTAYLGIGIRKANVFSSLLEKEKHTTNYYIDFQAKNPDSIKKMVSVILQKHKKLIIGIHQINRMPAAKFGMSQQALQVVDTLQKTIPSLICLFGNAYAARHLPQVKNLIIAYEDDSIIHKSLILLLKGEIPFKGTIPVSISPEWPAGKGLQSYIHPLPYLSPKESGLTQTLLQQIDSMVGDAITRKAMPGCSIMMVKDGKTIFQKAYGKLNYDENTAVKENTVYDLASLTKILSTNLCVMKLSEEGSLDIKKTLGDYLPSVRGTDKENIKIEKLLLHEAGLKSFIPFYKETLDKNHLPNKKFYCEKEKDCFATRVADKLMIRSDIVDTFYKRILESPVDKKETYLYSDNDFILLGKMVESISGNTLDYCVQNWFYEPMGLKRIGYLPLARLKKKEIAPTVAKDDFRQQELRGDVHDQGAALMGGVAGHAGLFSDTYDVACIMQMLLNGGVWNGQQFLKPETISQFTSYQSAISRRGLGFDKPERDNAKRNDPYPSAFVSEQTFGHTGFTGTCTWADPSSGLIFIFLSNRIYPSDNGVFRTLNLRSKIHDTFAKLVQKETSNALN